jgi:hypothetical protein
MMMATTKPIACLPPLLERCVPWQREAPNERAAVRPVHAIILSAPA